MNQSTTGWVLFIAAVGMMCTLLATDVSRLASWGQAATPQFTGEMLAHLGAVITAFIGGKIIPPDRNINARDRFDDVKNG